jgi:uncharacterized protein (DUF2062 family)
MEDLLEKDTNKPRPARIPLRQKIRTWMIQIRRLEGEPHYIARGLAIGVFIGVTPTMPFHTILAVAFAFLFHGSRPAAILGVWAGNPLTLPFFYFASYEIGTMLLGISTPFDSQMICSLTQFLELGLEITTAMIIGGILLATPFGLITYILAWKIYGRIGKRKSG